MTSRERFISSSVQRIKQLMTVDQQQAQRVVSYIKAEREFNAFLADGRVRMSMRRADNSYEEPENVDRYVYVKLTDRYFRRSREEVQKFYQDVGTDQDSEKIDSFIQCIHRGEEDTNKKKKISIARYAASTYSVTQKVEKLPEHQQEQVMSMLGYTNTEALDIVKRFRTSAKWTGITTISSQALALVSGAIGVKYPMVHGFDLPAVLESYGFNYGMLLLNIATNLKMLRHKKFKTCDNIVATSTYYIAKVPADKIPPRTVFLQISKALVLYTPTIFFEIFPGIFQEGPLIAAALLSSSSGFLINRNISDGVVNGVKAIIKLILLSINGNDPDEMKKPGALKKLLSSLKKKRQ